MHYLKALFTYLFYVLSTTDVVRSVAATVTRATVASVDIGGRLLISPERRSGCFIRRPLRTF